MAYANLVSQACTDNAELFKRVRDFLCRRNGSYDYSTTGIGWTLHDAVYASGNENTVAFNDYFVVYSAGEGGGQDIYIQVSYISGYLKMKACLYWDATTHTGVSVVDANNNWTNANSTATTLWIYGDLDSVFFVSKYYSSYYACIFGHCPDSQFATTIATSASAVSAGSDVVVTVDSVPSGWAAGRKVYIRDTANIEIITISSINGLDVTFASVVASYNAGCKLQGEVSYYSQNSTQSLTSFTPVISHANVKGTLHNLELFCVSTGASADSLAGKTPIIPFYFYTSNSMIGPLKNVYTINTSGIAAESTHTYNSVTYRHFYASRSLLVKEV